MKTQPIDSHLRCPRDSKRMVMEIGQDDVTGAGDLGVRHECLHCGYAEHGPSTPDAASKTSPNLRPLRELLRLQRLEGVVIPMVFDDAPWPEEVDA